MSQSNQMLNLLKKPPYWLHIAISPSGCSDCPFASIFDQDDPPNPADPDEGYYQCQLIKKKIWGEDPKCNTENWLKEISELISIMQPRPIRNDKQLAFYQNHLDHLVDKREFSQDEIDLRDLLGILISEYENKNPLPNAKPHEVIQQLMETQNISIVSVALALDGFAQKAIDICEGQRMPTDEECKALGKLFKVSPDVFKPG